MQAFPRAAPLREVVPATGSVCMVQPDPPQQQGWQVTAGLHSCQRLVLPGLSW